MASLELTRSNELRLPKEGLESQVLDGAQQTIARDRPLFTVESFPSSEPATYLTLMRKVVKLGYRAYEIDEQCGKPR